MTGAGRTVTAPPALRPGDTVAYVAPAGALAPGRAEGAVGLLRSRGLRVLVREDITSRHRTLAGTDERRVEELRRALEEPGIRAVFLARGGYGSQRILGRVLPGPDAEPRAVVGFSDNTALLNHLRQAAGWVTIHGPHPQAERAEETDEVLGCLGFFGEPQKSKFEGLELLSGGAYGRVEAEVAGGCLSLVSSSVGTPYALDCRGKILFLEDTAEPCYRLDRMLHHLWASGTLEGAAAVVFGRPESFVAAPEEETAVRHLLQEFAESVPVPVLAGLPCGHTRPNRPLPFGPLARLEPKAGTLTYLEPAVRP